MSLGSLVVAVGAGGVGKTTLAAALGVVSARSGRDTLVMTFDPSLRLKDALGVDLTAKEHEVRVDLGTPGRLDASLLDPRTTFDRLVARHAPDETTRTRILTNRFYRHLSGSLAGVLEYMAVERLFEVASEGRYQRIVLDTPPTRQALDFLDAPSRIIGFLDSGALRIALKPWFDDKGRLRPTRRLGILGRGVEAFFDTLVGLDLLRDMAEFFQAFAPLYEGFRARAVEVEKLLRREGTTFVVVAGAAQERIPDTMFLARTLRESGYHLGPVIVNRVHPRTEAGRLPDRSAVREGLELVRWLGELDARGVAELRSLLSREELIEIPLLPYGLSDLAGLSRLAELLERELRGTAAR